MVLAALMAELAPLGFGKIPRDSARVLPKQPAAARGETAGDASRVSHGESAGARREMAD